MIREEDMRYERTGPNDFWLELRRRGFTLTKAQFEDDPQVIRAQPGIITDTEGSFVSFYTAYGDTTVRKIVRSVFTSAKTRDQILATLRVNPAKLDKALAHLDAWGILACDDGAWHKGPACAYIDNLGTTLEWYVAAWFRRELEVPARHGVHLREVPSGDLDVVAFVKDEPMYIECKTSSPDDITEKDLRRFLQRAWEFNPPMAVLLIDTTSPLEGTETHLIKMLNDIYYDMASKELQLEGIITSPNIGPTIQPKSRYGSDFYWGARNIYVTNVRRSIADSLDAVRRHYFTEIRHRVSFVSGDRTLDFIYGQVR